MSLSKPDQPYTVTPEGLRLAVRLTPRGGRDGIGGVVLDADGRSLLQVRVSAPPVEGAANAALIALLAKALGVPKSALALVSGETARVKILRVSGDGAALAARLDALLSPR
ncbi:DUF167 family protein [Methylobacterium sp. sgz302541]|uniref:DUF167 family protein n=1 Tax=unclassified Methylobacterium TaxID=2615210 RepID=UPI003D3253B4